MHRIPSITNPGFTHQLTLHYAIRYGTVSSNSNWQNWGTGGSYIPLVSFALRLHATSCILAVANTKFLISTLHSGSTTVVTEPSIPSCVDTYVRPAVIATDHEVLAETTNTHATRLNTPMNTLTNALTQNVQDYTLCRSLSLSSCQI